MKEKELREHVDCSICKKPIGKTGMPIFWVVEMQRFGLDLNALRRNTGLAMQLGSVQLAGIMGPDEDLAKPIMEKKKITACEDCAARSHSIYEMALDEDGG